MKEIFHIQNKHAENVLKVLSLRLGEKHSGFSITNKQGNELYELAYCTAEFLNEKTVADFFAAYPSLQHAFSRVLVAYDFPGNILTPSAFYQTDELQSLLGSLYGILPGSNIISESIPEWHLFNTYAVPADIQGWVNKRFPSVQDWNQYTLSIKRIQAADDQGFLLVDFRNHDFTLLAAKSSKLLLAQSFLYTTPGDVLYYLLKTFHEFSLSQTEANIQLSGLIDEDSALYKELYQYFIRVEFREASWNKAGEYPAHFFTSLNDLARCAS